MYHTGFNSQRGFRRDTGNGNYQEDNYYYPENEQPTQRGRGRGGRSRGSTHQRRSNQRMEDHREKKGTEVRDANRDKIKDELFAGVEDEFNRLAEVQTLQANMLSVTSRGIGFGTTHLTYVATQYADNIRIPNIYSQYRAYLALFEAKVMNIVPQYPLIPRFAKAVNQHEGLNADFLRIIKTFTFVPTPIKRIVDAIG